MKIRYLILCCLLWGFSQRISAQKLEFGPKVGLNFSKLSGDDWSNGYKTNATGGLFLGIIGERFGVSVEGLYSQSTYTTGDDFNSVYSQYIQAGKDSIKNGTFRLNYINIPVLLNIKLGPMVRLQLGPQFSGVLSIKDSDDLVKDTKDVFKNGDISGVAGLQVNLPFHLVLNGRYVMGFTGLNESDVSDAWKQRQVQLTVGYNFL